MTSKGQIEIPFSRNKLITIMYGSIVFACVGIWFLINPPTIQKGLFSNPVLIQVVGIISMFFFGLCAFVFAQKLQSKTPGLIIDETGITDNASGISAGHIPWKDILAIKVSKIMKQKFILILVSNPDEYINRQKNILKRKTAAIYYKNYGSPISITSNGLQCSFDKLENILRTELIKNKK